MNLGTMEFGSLRTLDIAIIRYLGLQGSHCLQTRHVSSIDGIFG